MKADRPKQLLDLDGTPILVYTLRKFDRCAVIDHIIVTVPHESAEEIRTLVMQAGLRKPVTVVEGGEKRQDSVWIGSQLFITKSVTRHHVFHLWSTS